MSLYKKLCTSKNGPVFWPTLYMYSGCAEWTSYYYDCTCTPCGAVVLLSVCLRSVSVSPSVYVCAKTEKKTLNKDWSNLLCSTVNARSDYILVIFDVESCFSTSIWRDAHALCEKCRPDTCICVPHCITLPSRAPSSLHMESFVVVFVDLYQTELLVELSMNFVNCL